MTRHTILHGLALCCVGAFAGVSPVAAEQARGVFLQEADGTRLRIGTLNLAEDGEYTLRMAEEPFTDHFLSMRPFRCLEGAEKTWCHVPYPYAIRRNIAEDMTDLEYDLLFLWKDRTDYGIDMWNGLYYRIEPEGEGFRGTLHEMDMDLLSAPPPEGEMRPLRDQDIIETDPDSHWLPALIIE